MSKKSNVHPDYYKTAGRDRQDDAAAGRLARAIAAKPASQQRPDRMSKGPYFQRPEPARPASAGPPADRAQKDASTREGTAKPTKKSETRKASAPRRTATPRKAASIGQKKSGKAPARPTKKR